MKSLSITTSNRPSVGGIGGGAFVESVKVQFKKFYQILSCPEQNSYYWLPKMYGVLEANPTKNDF
jgi:hypothetical protein